MGHDPPLLDEVLDLARGRIRVAIRERCAPEELIVTSFLDDVVRQVKHANPSIKTGLLVGRHKPRRLVRTRLAEAFPVARAKRWGADYFGAHHKLARIGGLSRAAAAGYRALVWTLNEDDPLKRFLTDERMLGVVTDVPARALELRDELETTASPRPRARR